MGGANDSIRGGAWILLIVVLIFPSVAAAIDPPDPLNVLFVANGWYDQEDDIEEHLLDLGCDVTVKKDYRVYGSTDLSVYDLIVITEFAPGLSYSALGNIESSGVPVLIVEYWDFWYSYRLGLTSTEYCGYVGTDWIEHVDPSGLVHTVLGSEIPVYESTYTIYGISSQDIKEGVKPLAYSSRSFDEYAVIIDEERKIAATGVYDTTRYTEESWRYFDLLVGSIAQVGPQWPDTLSALDGFAQSGLMSYLDHLTGREDPQTVRAFVWDMIVGYNLFEFIHPINDQLQTYDADIEILWPGIFTLGVPHPPLDEEDYPDALWMLGEHETAPFDWYNPAYGTYITGADLGVSARYWGTTYFYMGDTWTSGFPGRAGCDQVTGVGFAECDDAMLYLKVGEDDPTDGVDVTLLHDTVDSSRFRSTAIDGVHRNFDHEVWADWDGNYEHVVNEDFSVPTGAVSYDVPVTVFVPVWMEYPAYNKTFYIKRVQLWYATQVTRSAVDDPSDTRAGKSWVGCSNNGKDFNNCYDFVNGNEIDFAYFSKEKFMQVAPVRVSAATVAAMDPAPPKENPSPEGGFLLYGTGQPYRTSGLYLAYVDWGDFGKVNADNDRPQNVYFFRKYQGNPGWIVNEEVEATPITNFTHYISTQAEFTDEGLQGEWDDMVQITRAYLEEFLWSQRVLINEEDEDEGDPCDDESCDYAECAWALGSVECTLCDEDDIHLCIDDIIDATFEYRRSMPEHTDGLGELSVKRVSMSVGSGGVDTLVFLSNHPYLGDPERQEMLDAIDVGVVNNPFLADPTGAFSVYDYSWRYGRVYLRTANPLTPWDLSAPKNTGNAGYGPYIMDEFTDVVPSMCDGGKLPDFPGYDVSLWHTVSSWHGPFLPGAYGVYTTSSQVCIPEVE